MTKRRDQPSKMRLKARPIGSSPRWTSGKILIQALILSVLLALFVAVAIPVLHLITPSNTRPKHLADLQFVSEPTPTPVPATRPASMLTNANPTYCGTVATVLAGNSTQSVHPAAVPSLTPTSEPVIIVNDTGSHSARLSGAGRKAAERERREAERKRSRLEAMYQNHLISSAAYKKGQDKYQSEIAKYRGELNGTASTNE
jgi:hypothetical protein